MALAGASPNAASGAISELLGAKVRAAQKVGLKVLFCIGETAEQVPARKEVLARQIEGGLGTADMANVVIAYEPVWAIGPGKTLPRHGESPISRRTSRDSSPVPSSTEAVSRRKTLPRSGQFPNSTAGSSR